MPATAVLSRQPHARQAAPLDREQGGASSLHPDGVAALAVIGRTTTLNAATYGAQETDDALLFARQPCGMTPTT